MKNQPDDLFEEGLTVKTVPSYQSQRIHSFTAPTLKELKLHQLYVLTNSLQDSHIFQEAHDTCEIAFIYMQRHKHMIGMSFGQWFDNAHSLKDEDLYWAVTTLEAKRIIVRKGYNRLSLEPLMHYNAGIGKGE